ncbi:MAG: NERD domain-containing protein, partial [Actinomycetota bacterium]
MTSSADVDTPTALRRPTPVAPGASGRCPSGVIDRRAPQSDTPWRRRLAERRLGPLLERAIAESGTVLHHRSVRSAGAGQTDSIDHLVVAPTGLWVVRAIHADGSLHVDSAAGSVSITVGGVRHAEVLLRESAIESALRDALGSIGYDWVEIRPAICITRMKIWPRRVAGCLVTTPRRLVSAT